MLSIPIKFQNLQIEIRLSQQSSASDITILRPQECSFLGKYCEDLSIADFCALLINTIKTLRSKSQPVLDLQIYTNHSLCMSIPHPVRREITNFGSVDILFENETLGVYRLNIAPQHQIRPHFHTQMIEHERVLTHGLLDLQSSPLNCGREFSWKLNEPHAYINPTSTTQSVLCINQPKFIPDDEQAWTG